MICDIKSQSIPIVRQNLKCGFDINNLAAGRESCQEGWYEWIGKNHCINKIVLDVGAGMCEGIKLMRKLGVAEAWGQEIDNRLQYLDNKLIIKNIQDIENKSFDIITCFDVIEHIINDLDFFNHLKRIAKEKIFITTPNFTRSKAQNHCHCREYTIPQFANIFKPDELWSAAPDGKTHHKLLLKRINNRFIDFTRNKIQLNYIPDELSFTHSTVDGYEWPHICGIFNLSKI